MSNKVVYLASLTFAVDDLNFIVEELLKRAQFLELLAGGMDELERPEKKVEYAMEARRCKEISYSIARVGQQEIR